MNRKRVIAYIDKLLKTKKDDYLLIPRNMLEQIKVWLELGEQNG